MLSFSTGGKARTKAGVMIETETKKSRTGKAEHAGERREVEEDDWVLDGGKLPRR